MTSHPWGQPFRLDLILRHTGPPRLELLDRLRQELRVQVEADGADVPALAHTEKRPGAADLEVFHGNAESGAQLGGLEDRLQTPLGDLGQPLAFVIQEVGIGQVGAPPDAPS